MIIVPPHEPVPPSLKGGVVAIGNYDGVHRGHLALLEQARARAIALSAPFVVLTFNPHPRLFFRAETQPFLITPPPLKMERLAATQVDGVVTLTFDSNLAHQTPGDFIQTILKDKLNAAHVFTGTDFHFGHNRAGNIETIRTNGIPATGINLISDQTGAPYSSTRIRAFLQEGQIEDANRLLGWPWEMRGTVIHGEKRGRELGFPTANIKLENTLIPAYGIYAAWVRIEHENIWHKAVFSLGIRPMFALPAPLLEVHLLDFKGDLYDLPLRIRPVHHLRPEQNFDGLDTLIRQIEADCDAARALLEKDRTNA